MLYFILALPLTPRGFNILMSVICKFSKHITLIKGINTWFAQQWAHAFMKHLNLVDWGLLEELITDRDPKFLNKFCTTLFTKLGVKLFYSTAYHLQPNGSSKRSNQTIEIALRVFVYRLKNLSQWPKILLWIQFILNNTLFLIISKTPNKISYGFSL